MNIKKLENGNYEIDRETHFPPIINDFIDCFNFGNSRKI